MKKIVMTVAAACAAGMLMGASANVAHAPPGTDNIAFGYGAGYGASGSNIDVLCIGTDAGKNTSNNESCIFIGSNAGANVSGKTGAVYIGDVVKYNGIGSNFDIDAPIKNTGSQLHDWASVGSMSFVNEDFSSVFIYNNNEDTLAFYKSLNVHQGANINFWQDGNAPDYEIQNKNSTLDIYARNDKDITITSEGGSLVLNSNKKMYVQADAGLSLLFADKVGAYLAFDGASLCVYTNNVKVGTLTFTPAN